MSILSAIKNFLPSTADVAADRRQLVFGTTSKAAVGATIVGAAAALIAAPALITKAGGIGAVAKTAATAIGKLPLGVKVVGAIAAPVAIGAITSHPTVITKTPPALANFASNLYSVGKEPSIANVKNLFTENPIVSTLAGGALLASFAPLGVAAVNLANTAATRANTSAILGSSTSPPTTTASAGALPKEATTASKSIASATPVLPQTQTLSPTTTRSVARRKKAVALPSAMRQYTRINIINAANSRIGSYISRRYA